MDIQSYVIFKKYGLEVSWSAAPKDSHINIVHGRDFGIRERTLNSFIVCMQGDAHHMKISNFNLLQNAQFGCGPRHNWLVFWTQLGLKPRDDSRNYIIENIAFKGAKVNLDPAYDGPHFRQRLQKLGVCLQIDTQDSEEPNKWADYHNIDLVLAVRNCTVSDARGKPATKLLNAWRAGSPALLGPEPAYFELRRSELDYIEIRSPEDVIKAVELLKVDQKRYKAMIEHGRRRAEEFVLDALVGRWIALLNGPVSQAFESWNKTSRFRRAGRFAITAMSEKYARWIYHRRIHTGPRIMDRNHEFEGQKKALLV